MERATRELPGMSYDLVVYQLLIVCGDHPWVRVRHGPTETTGGTHMKVVRSLKKKITGEKSLKAYAWYHWY